jgi:hypothetical protein
LNKKGEYFSQTGKIADKLHSLTVNFTGVCCYNNKGEEIAKIVFIDEYHFMIDPK